MRAAAWVAQLGVLVVHVMPLLRVIAQSVEFGEWVGLVHGGDIVPRVVADRCAPPGAPVDKAGPADHCVIA